MLRAIDSVSPSLIEHLAVPDMLEWSEGDHLDGRREKLRRIISDDRVPFRE